MNARAGRPTAQEAAWLAHVPDHIADAVLAGEPTLDRVRRFPAAVLFVDVLGFTALSEALGREGRAGTETLRETLYAFFEPLVGLVRAAGGDVIQFAGDAMTSLFALGDDPQDAARRAARCALELAEAAAASGAATPPGTPALAIKSGLAGGEVVALTVGDADVRLVPVVAGEPLRRSGSAERHAGTGEVVVDDVVLSLAGGAIRGTAVAPGYTTVADVAGPAVDLDVAARRTGRGDVADRVAPYLPPVVAARLRAGHADLLGEHRAVTVAFVSLSGVAAGEPAFERHYRDAVGIVERYGGCLVQIDVVDGASRSLVSFGAPVLHEDDPERALACALDLRALGQDAVSAGIATGLAYCGAVGAASRHGYSLLGDAVNAAARLCSLARPGEVLVADETRRRAEGFAWHDRGQVTLRGRAEPVAIHALVGEPRTTRQPVVDVRESPLVGRPRERAAVRDALDDAAAGHGRIVLLAGPAGIGKSRLVAEATSLARERGLATPTGACRSHGGEGYDVWRPIWHELLGLDPAWPAEARRRRLEARLAAEDASLLPRAPLLRSVLGMPIPDSDLTRSFDAEGFRSSLADLLLDLLRRRAADGPLLLVLEDCHWIDPASRDLLELLARNVADLPVAVLATRRDDGGEDPLAALARFGHARTVALQELGGADLAEVARHAVRRLYGADVAVDDEALERIGARAEGNPFAVEELVGLLHDRGLDPSAPEAAAMDVPDRLGSLVLARVDVLPEDAKTVLKVASVVGREFSARWLFGSQPSLGGPDDVRRALAALAERQLTAPIGGEAGGRHRFRHALVQDAVYDSLALSARAALHERVATFVEAAEDPDEHVEVLAYHYGRSSNTGAQRIWFRRAALAARDRYANEAAIGHLERLLPLLGRDETGPVVLLLGQVRQLAGRWAGAEADFRAALAAAEPAGDASGAAAAQAALGGLLSYTGSFEEALVALRAARERFAALRDRAGLAGMLEVLAFTEIRSADYDAAAATAREHLELARAAGDGAAESAALNNLGVVAWYEGRHADALAALGESLEVAAAGGHEVRVVRAANDLGGVHAELGDAAAALAHLGRAAEAAARIGYRHATGVIAGNAGELCLDRGDLDQALAFKAAALTIATELGDEAHVLDTIGSLGVVAAAGGHATEAEELLRLSIDMARALDAPYYLSQYLFHLAVLFAGHGRDAEALDALRELHALPSHARHPEGAARAETLAIRLAAELGELEPAAALARLEGLASAAADEEGVAVARQALWQLDPAREGDRADAVRLVRALHQRTPRAAYRALHLELTGEPLPAPPPLDAVPGVPAEPETTLATVVERARLVTPAAAT